MLNFFYGVITTWFLCGLGYCFWWGENNLFTAVMELPGKIAEVFFYIVCYPAIWFYCVFIRHTRKPVSIDVLEVQKIIDDSKRIWGNLYFCYDSGARAFRNKMFFFRVSDKIDNPNKPTSPEGGFRIGSEYWNGDE